MIISKQKQAWAIILFSCLVSGLLVVDPGQATRMQNEVETIEVAVAPLNTEAEIPDYLAQAEQMLRVGRFESVRVMSEKVLTMQPNNVNARALLAGAYAGLGNQDRAGQETSKVRDTNPGNSNLYLFSALAYQAIGRPDKAEQLYKNGIKNSTDTTELSMQLAGLYGQQGEYTEASALYEKVLQQKDVTVKDYLNASFSLCRIDLQLEEYDRVIKRAVVIVDNYPQLLQGYQFMATAYLKKGKPDQAVEPYKKLLQVNQSFSEPYQELALIYMDQLGDSGKAVEYAEKAAGKFPKDPKAQDVLGWVLYKGNKLDQAVHQFASAIKLAPDQAVYHYHLGLAELQMGNNDRAKNSFEEALSLIDQQGAQDFAVELNKRIRESGK